MPVKFGIIGGGVMAEAILSRLLQQKLYAPNEVLISDPKESRRAWLKKYALPRPACRACSEKKRPGGRPPAPIGILVANASAKVIT
jgi:pyrroline-5-carboxylate reductase